MASSLKALLPGGSAARPIGSHVWFPNVDNPDVSPLIVTDSATYLRSGNILTNQQADYPDAFAKFSVKAGLEPWATSILPPVYWDSLIYGDGTFVGFSSVAGMATYSADDGDTWGTSILPGGGAYSLPTYGGGTFAIISAHSNTVNYSSNGGKNWATSTLPTAAGWDPITYGDGVFVAVNYGTTDAAYSTDGCKTWTLSTLPSKANWDTVTYGDGVFIASTGTKAARSTDGGKTWSAQALPMYGGGRAVYVDGVFVRVGAYSTDGGNTWVQSTMPIAGLWSDVAYGDGMLVTVCANTTNAAYSTDKGKTWTASDLPFNVYWRALAYGDGKFVAITPPINGESPAQSHLARTSSITSLGTATPILSPSTESIRYMRVK